MNRSRPGRTALGTIGAISVLALATISARATDSVYVRDGPGAMSAQAPGPICPAPPEGEKAAFRSSGDRRWYSLVPGGTFTGVHGWSLSGGARVVDTGASRGGSRDAARRALQLPPGASAASPPTCVRTGRLALRALTRSRMGQRTGLNVAVVGVENRTVPTSRLPTPSSPVIDVTAAPYHADHRGRGDAGPAISRAIGDVSEKGGGVVSLPRGTYALHTPVRLRDGVRLRGAGVRRTSLVVAGAGVRPAAITGFAGDSVSGVVVERLTVDGAFARSRAAANGIQVADGRRVAVRHVRVKRTGRNGIVFLAENGGGGDVAVESSSVSASGEDSPTGEDGFGVRIIGIPGAVVRDNSLVGNRGMGVGLAGSAPGGLILRNSIRQGLSTIGFEAIGLTDGSNEAIVQGNRITDSQDNGISLSGSRSIARNNRVDGTLDHGIASAGDGNLIEANTIRNVGRADAAGTPVRAGVALSGRGITVTRNVIESDPATSTMGYGIKQNQEAGGHQISDNDISGYRQTRYWFTPKGVPTLSADTSVLEGPAFPPSPAVKWTSRDRWRLSGRYPVLAGASGGAVWVRVVLSNSGARPVQVDAPRLRVRP